MKRNGLRRKYRVRLAPINASKQLLMNQHRIIEVGTLLCH